MNSIKITTFYVTLMDTLQTYNAREITIYSLDPYENLKTLRNLLLNSMEPFYEEISRSWQRESQKKLLEMALEMLASRGLSIYWW